MNNFNIWITIEDDELEFNDFAEARCELERLGIYEHDKIGVILTHNQWSNLLKIISKFEQRFINPSKLPQQIMGFPVKIIDYE
jgi:hypothetical protein